MSEGGNVQGGRPRFRPEQQQLQLRSLTTTIHQSSDSRGQ